MLNQSRLAVLKTRDDSVKQIVEETRLRLGKITEDAPKYRKMLEDLIAQVKWMLSLPFPHQMSLICLVSYPTLIT